MFHGKQLINGVKNIIYKMGVVGSSPTLSTKNIMGLNGIERYASGKGQAVGIHFK